MRTAFQTLRWNQYQGSSGCAGVADFARLPAFCRANFWICCIYNGGIETLDLRIGVRNLRPPSQLNWKNPGRRDPNWGLRYPRRR